MPIIRSRSLALLLAAAAALGACRSAPPSATAATSRPPESPVALATGSVPPGYYSALDRGGIEAAALACNSQNRYGRDLRGDARAAAARVLSGLGAPAEEELVDTVADIVFWEMVRTLLVEGENNNLGAVVLDGITWTDETGRERPVVVFRSGFTPDPAGPGSCYQTLLDAGMVRHVVNLYDGDMVVDDLVDGERRAAAERGASYVVTAEQDYGSWRDALREHLGDESRRGQAMADLARVIREQVLAPGGRPPRGNILIHCGGGMHRSGMVTGILQQAVNGDAWHEIEAGYRYHVGYQDPRSPGGFEAGNLEVIRDFDPTMLRQ